VIGAREMEAFVCEDPDDCNLLMLRLRDGQKLQKISVINARYELPKLLNLRGNFENLAYFSQIFENEFVFITQA